MQTPIVTRLLLFVNIAAFLLTPLAGGGVFQTFGLVPAAFHPWQPITSMFLHGGLAHIGFNMLALWSIGAPIERDLGTARFAKLYFLSGLGGAGLVLLLPLLSAIGINAGDPTIATIGASGAIAGLLGALAVFYPRATMLLFFVIPVKARTLAIGFGVVSLYFMFGEGSGGISHSGHLGGLIAGLIYSKFAVASARSQTGNRGPVMTPSGGSAGDRTRLMQELLRDLLRNPSRGMRHHGRFLDPYEPMPDQRAGHTERVVRDVDAAEGPQKRLYYDPATGTFFFR